MTKAQRLLEIIERIGLKFDMPMDFSKEISNVSPDKARKLIKRAGIPVSRVSQNKKLNKTFFINKQKPVAVFDPKKKTLRIV